MVMANRFFLVLFSFLLVGCGRSILSERGGYLRAYHEGRFNEANQQLNQLVKSEMSSGQYTQSKEATWLLLDRATTRFASGDVEGAIQDYAVSMESLDYYGQNLPAEQLAQVLLEDETAAYQAADFEQVLARIYFALALLHQGDESNAYALLRSAEEFQQEREYQYQRVSFTRDYRIFDNGLGKYLLALLSERKGDCANAQLLYHQATELALAPISIPSDSRGLATVVIICHNGNSPFKISETCSGSVASALALEILLGVNRVNPAFSTLTGIPVPALRRWPCSEPVRTVVTLDCEEDTCKPLFSVEYAAQEELNQKMGVIAAKGAARLILRRGTVAYLGKQDPLLGFAADLTCMAINSQTRADTRSWTTLPAVLDLARFDVSAGTHQMTIQVRDCFGRFQTVQTDLKLPVNGLCIVNIFNIHPGNTEVLIPKRFLNKENRYER